MFLTCVIDIPNRWSLSVKLHRYKKPNFVVYQL